MLLMERVLGYRIPKVTSRPNLAALTILLRLSGGVRKVQKQRILNQQHKFIYTMERKESTS
jgi:hypothetical protein